MYIKPNPAMNIVDPDMGDFLPAGGRNVIDSPYWQRLLRDKDVDQADPPPEQESPPATTPLN